MKRIIPLIFLLLAGYMAVRAQISGQAEVNVNDLSFSKQDGYDVIRWNGGDYKIQQAGAPELPVILKTYVVPLEAKLTGVEVSVSNRMAVNGNFMPYPVQPPIPITEKQDEVKFTQPDASIYQGTEVYPKIKAQIVADYNEMGYHLVTVQLHPVEYDPVSQKLFVSHLNFVLRYDMVGVDGVQSQKQSVRRANAIKKVIRSMVDNPEDVDVFTSSKVKLVGEAVMDVQTRVASASMPIDVIQEQIPDYIIITNNKLKGEFQRLADWKTQKGVPTLVKDVESIGKEYQGSDLAEKIHTYLQECYHKWGAGLFVLLGGDTNIIPARCYIYSNVEYPSDAYYTDLESDWNANKNHIYKETGDGMNMDRLCYLGRASVEDIEEAKTFINKVLMYEKMENVSTEYLMNHLAISAYISKDESKDSLYNDGKESINGYLSHYPQITKWYLFDHYNCTCPRHHDKTMYHSGQELNKEHFLSALQDGGDSGLDHFHIVYHMDHSHPRALGASSKDKHESIYIQDVNNLINGDYPLIMISGGCKPAKFTEDCIAEHFLTNPLGGAVAFIGNANDGYADETYQYNNFLAALYRKHIYHIGTILNQMINYNDFSTIHEYYRLHLLGDPEMPVWSAVPQKLEVYVTPTQIAAGTNTITVQITNLPAGEEATVCLMKDAEAYTVVTINDTKPHSFTFNPKTSGEMKVTVTARNYIPFEKSIPVSRPEENLITIAEIRNFSGTLRTGGTANLDICLKNDGKDRAFDVTAKLSTSSPYITMINDSVYYGEVSGTYYPVPGQTQFSFKIAEDAPEIGRYEWNAVCFYLTISRRGTDAVNVDTFKVDLKQNKQKLFRIMIRRTSDGDLIPEAGEKVTLSVAKRTEGITSDMTCSVVSLDTTTATVNKRNATSTTAFINISNKYKTGNPIPLKIVLYTAGVAQDSVITDIAEKAVPIDLSKVHTELGNNSISLYWDKMGSEELYNIYRSNREDGGFVLQNKYPVSTRYYKDEGLDPLTTYYYKLNTLTSGYIEGEKSEAVRAWTIYPTMGMFPLSMGKSLHYTCEAHTADFDYDGQKEIFLTGYTDEGTEGMVVAIRPDGTEPYDLDGNATSYSGYAEIPWKAEATPVVADLLGNGEQYIISLTRNYNKCDDYVTCYSSLDKDGDKLPDMLWRTNIGMMSCYRPPVVTDVDAPDGKGEKEIVFRSEFEKKPIVIMDAHGNIKASFGNLSGDFFGEPAVADLDGDGYKEIICGSSDGHVYVWQHDGKPYLRSPFFSRPGQMLNCSPTICDLDGDGEKEILVTTRNTNLSYIYAIRQDGSCVGNFDSNASTPACIPYVSNGIEHPLSVGDVNGDGRLEVVALGYDCVRIWSDAGELLINRSLPGLLTESYINLTCPLLADVDGDDAIDIVFHQDNLIYALHNDGTDITGFPLSTADKMDNGVCVSDVDGDGKNEIIAADKSGNIYAWKTNGKSTAIEWGRSRFDTGFTGEYIPHYEDPKVLTSSTEWGGGAFTNDIIVRSGTFKIPSGKTLQMRDGYRIYVLEGGTLEVDGGTIQNADVLVKSGGTLNIKNNGGIHLNRYGKLNAEKGAIVNALYGEVQTAR
ncbi:FG-GAP repeat protein [Paraprevotella xylaniphila YIT 11841]|uniref:FG-GAP repeat protein n=1 Tax=Paraprevotella xylaniphila YIT 11841 TaxID=762982 RepID=F3QXZ8_9BACT|nr:C25 family cysteine peptidase [Paraprevotella xylaniphila]EGG50856.1 FG-GAP repeat protein [Paraprevotella xylaniphila YIT 11841]